ncbi:helix-turn-helix domain-containing protein [Variovorax sp. JS1663]|uniref:helix-turn-helix domain-containing protein n=1 Tax=Variovorax sp. JS1663 TaxID=1851577 RepID=UPI000B348520|nr:helix-turn-helix transcriptional regulator [Variovorax sp. JS1663]OUM02454.1 transcriptional regulator [Variovorax sp. JS1663]OUM02461.1 transcriptional regulator [Variovorax sp. JS1663]
MHQVLSLSSQLGAWIKAARRDAGLSQHALAERLGISQSRVSHMELNPGSVSVEQLLAICAVLGLEIMVGPRLASPAPGEPHGVREPPPVEW